MMFLYVLNCELDTGPVSQLQWTRDERALAVGYKKRGISLWSIHGCRLHSTIPIHPIRSDSISKLQRDFYEISSSMEVFNISTESTHTSREVLRNGVSAMVHHFVLLNFFANVSN